MVFSLVDLFSGGGGMSYGFHAHPAFEVIGAVDAQIGKPSSKRGSLACNSTYELNMGFAPIQEDLAVVAPRKIRAASKLKGRSTFLRHARLAQASRGPRPTITWSTMIATVSFLGPRYSLKNYSRESWSWRTLANCCLATSATTSKLKDGPTGHAYTVYAQTRMLTRVGLPQVRERALVVAVAEGVEVRTLDELWEDFTVDPSATTIRRLWALAPAAGGEIDARIRRMLTKFSAPGSLERLRRSHTTAVRGVTCGNSQTDLF